MDDLVTRAELAELRQENADRHQQIIDAIGTSETRINQRTEQLDTRINGRIKRMETNQEVTNKRLDAVEAWMRAKEVVSEFFVNKTKNPLVIFLLGAAVTLGGTFWVNNTNEGNKPTNTTTTNNNSDLGSCETRLANLKVSLAGKLITKDYYDIQYTRIKAGDC